MTVGEVQHQRRAGEEAPVNARPKSRSQGIGPRLISTGEGSIKDGL